MISNNDLHWLAGIIEGEGCFSVSVNRKTAKTFKISVGMTDLDVITRVSRLLHGRTILHKNGNGIRDGYARKILYDITIQGPKAIGWMMTLYTLMGKRRRFRIKELILQWKNYNPIIGPVKGKRRGPYKKAVQPSIEVRSTALFNPSNINWDVAKSLGLKKEK